MGNDEPSENTSSNLEVLRFLWKKIVWIYHSKYDVYHKSEINIQSEFRMFDESINAFYFSKNIRKLKHCMKIDNLKAEYYFNIK